MTFRVVVERTSYMQKEFMVTAADAESAKRRAVDLAGNTAFTLNDEVDSLYVACDAYPLHIVDDDEEEP